MKRIGELERAYVLEVLDEGFRTSSGSMMTKRLESAFAQLVGTKYAITFVNGTATLHAALVAAGVGPGDEVIVPPLTAAMTTLAVLHAGATPVYADVHPEYWTLDPAAVAAAITSRTKAIIPVAIYGLAPQMDDLMSLADAHGIFVLEDDAQCVGGIYRGRPVGSIGHAASFSFQSSKHLTSGEGGMIVTDDPGLAERVRRFNSLGYATVSAGAGKGKIGKDIIQDPEYARHSTLGFNYRMPELCAAVLLAQVERSEAIVNCSRETAAMYEEARGDCQWLIPQAAPPDVTHAYWTWAVRIDPQASVSWHDFRNKFRVLTGEGIYACWRLTYNEPVMADRAHDFVCPVAESLQPTILQFKTNYLVSDERDHVVRGLQQTIAHFDG